MKKFLLGMGVGIILICALGIVSAMVRQHGAVKAEREARAAAVAAAEAAATRAPSGESGKK